MDPSIQQPIQDAVQQGLDSLPISVHSLVMASLLAGIAMWLAGRHILRFAFVLVGMASARLAAHLVFPLLTTSVPPLVAIVIGAALGGVLSFFAFRVTIAIWLAIIGSALAAAVCIIVVGIKAPEPPELDSAIHELVRPDFTSNEDDSIEPLEFSPPQVQELSDSERAAMERVRDFARHLGTETNRMWHDIPSRDRLKLVSSSLLGLGLGAVLGFFAPKRSAAIITATIGAAVVMASALWLAAAAAIEPPKLPIPVYVMVWIVLSAVGMKVQFMGHRKPADNAD